MYAFSSWRRIWRGEKFGSSLDPDPDAKYEPFRLVLSTLIFPVFVLAGMLQFCTSVVEVYQFRSIDLGRVTGMIVRKVDSESDAGSAGRRLEDAEKLRIGLALLRRCNSEVFVNHEWFKNGYRMQLMLDGSASDFFISAYLETNRSKHKPGVVAGGQPLRLPGI